MAKKKLLFRGASEETPAATSTSGKKLKFGALASRISGLKVDVKKPS